MSSERVVIFGLGQVDRERAHLTVGFSELELARTVSQHDSATGREVFFLEIVRWDKRRVSVKYFYYNF